MKIGVSCFLFRQLKAKIDGAKEIVVKCEGTELRYESEMESALLNIGDYTGMKNVKKKKCVWHLGIVAFVLLINILVDDIIIIILFVFATLFY